MMERTEVHDPIHIQPPAAARARSLARAAVPFLAALLYFAVAVALQWVSGAYASDFGGYPDEPGHYVTGLMVRDYVIHGLPAHPLQFAENYYLHYPKVALGHWPPVFYVIEAAWMLVFPDSRASVLILMAALSMSLALCLYRETKNRFGMIWGLLAGLILVCLPVTQWVTSVIMADLLTAVFMFLAIVRFARFLDRDRWQDACWFGLWASVAILTKGNAWALACAVPLAVVLRRDFKRLATARFWLPAIVVLAVCGPYHVFAWKMIQHGWPDDPGALRSSLRAVPLLSGFLVSTVGWPLFVFLLLGFYRKIVLPLRHNSLESDWASMAALIAGFFGFHLVLYHDITELRYFIMVAPCMLLFVVAGIEWVREAAFLRRLPPAVSAAALAVCLGGAFAIWTFRIPPRPSHGFSGIARDLVSAPGLKDSVFLVSSSDFGEGMFIAEVAEHEQRPSHFVLRATQQLVRSSWGGDVYSLRYQTPADIIRALEDIPVSVVVMHTTWSSAPMPPHHALLREGLKAFPQDWQEVASSLSPPGRLPPEEIRVYRLQRVTPGSPRRVTVDLTNKLNKVLTGQF